MEDRQTGFGTYVRLSGMMFLQFAIWGAWAVLIAGHMQNLGFTGKQISYVFGTTAIGAIISPIIAGWIADRLMPSTGVCSDLSFTRWCVSTFCLETDELPDDVGCNFPARRSLHAYNRADECHRFPPHGTVR